MEESSFPLLKRGWKTMKKWWKPPQSVDVIYDQIVLGKPDQGIIIPFDDTNNNNLLTCPITLDTLIFAEAETIHQDEIFASSWSDFRTSRIIDPSPASTRILDCCMASLLQFVDENTLSSSSSSHRRMSLPDRCAVLSCSDGYDHPMTDEEQILIATAAFLCSQHLNLVFAKMFKERVSQHRTESVADWNTLFSYHDIMTAMDTAQAHIHASLAAFSSTNMGMNMDVGMGNVSIVAFPSTSQPRRSPRTSTAAASAADLPPPPPHHHRHSKDAPASSSLPIEPQGPLMYDVIALGVGDCAAIAFVPTDGDDPAQAAYTCHVLYQPVEYPLSFGQPTTTSTANNVYGPTSFLETHKPRDRAIDFYQLPEHSVVVLFTDGCWSQFSSGKEIKQRFVDDDRQSYIAHQLDTDALTQVFLALPSYARQDARCIASAIRQEATQRSERRRQQLATLVTTLDTYRRHATTFDVTSLQYWDAEKGRYQPYRWKQRHELPTTTVLSPEIIDACTALIALEGFSEEIPIVSLLEYRPVCGDDASVLVYVLPSSTEAIIRAMLDVLRETDRVITSTSDLMVIDSVQRDKQQKLDVWFHQLWQQQASEGGGGGIRHHQTMERQENENEDEEECEEEEEQEDGWKAMIRTAMSKVILDISIEHGVISGSVVPVVNLYRWLLEEKESARITCHRPTGRRRMQDEYTLARFYTRRARGTGDGNGDGGGDGESARSLRSKYDAAVVTELMDFIDHKLASLRAVR